MQRSGGLTCADQGLSAGAKARYRKTPRLRHVTRADLREPRRHVGAKPAIGRVTVVETRRSAPIATTVFGDLEASRWMLTEESMP